MIGRSYSVLGPFTGSDQSLSRSLSPVDPVPNRSSPATRRRHLFSHWKLLLHLPTGQFSGHTRCRKLQKAIQYPETRFRSVQ
jgi:hypothetical protein